MRDAPRQLGSIAFADGGCGPARQSADGRRVFCPLCRGPVRELLEMAGD